MVGDDSLRLIGKIYDGDKAKLKDAKYLRASIKTFRKTEKSRAALKQMDKIASNNYLTKKQLARFYDILMDCTIQWQKDWGLPRPPVTRRDRSNG